jgi:hypothetical protein
MRWPERLAVLALVAAAISLLLGSILSALAFALCAFMGWTRQFERSRAEGKPTLSDAGRIAVATILAAVGALLLLWSRAGPIPIASTVQTFGKEEAIDACKQGVLTRATHPSTVAFPTFDYNVRDEGGGHTKVLMSFQAKNGFGLELKYDAECELTGTIIDRVLISEASR